MEKLFGQLILAPLNKTGSVRLCPPAPLYKQYFWYLIYILQDRKTTDGNLNKYILKSQNLQSQNIMGPLISTYIEIPV